MGKKGFPNVQDGVHVIRVHCDIWTCADGGIKGFREDRLWKIAKELLEQDRGQMWVIESVH